MGIFEIKNNNYILKAPNGQVILKGISDNGSMSACLNTIESVRKNCSDDIRFEKRVDKNDNLYFVLKARNGQIIGISQEYASTAGMDNGILSVKKNAPTAKIKEL